MNCFALVDPLLLAQPDMSSKQNLSGVDIYQDFQKKNVFYYTPQDIRVKTASTGSPAFMLLQMRYTGTHLYGDQNEKRFLNILQLSVELPGMLSSVYDHIMNSLGDKAELKPIPLSRFYGELIIPLGDQAAANEKYRKVSLGGLEASGTSSSGTTFWQERTFTMQLQNDEAQLLWDQMETGKLGLSFSYSFYTEAIPGTVGEIDASGTNPDLIDAVEGIKEEVTIDENIHSYLLKANTFPITITSADFPNCLKQVDVNEELPPSYAAFEVRCYDFSDDLRPELLKKIVEIKAFAAGKDYITVKSIFNRNTKDLNSMVSRFPYAIRLDHALEYRVTEINANGEMTTGPWIEKTNWAEVIDVTTPGKTNPIGKQVIDFEIDLDSLSKFNLETATCEIVYRFNQQDVSQKLIWSRDDSPIKTIQVSYDKNQPVRYRILLEDINGDVQKLAFHPIRPADHYFYLNLHEQ
jgi:hypothetical protein